MHALRRQKAATKLQAAQRGRVCRTRHGKLRAAAVVVQKNARMAAARKAYAEKLEKKRVQESYEGQLKEARQRLEAYVQGVASVYLHAEGTWLHGAVGVAVSSDEVAARVRVAQARWWLGLGWCNRLET